MYREGRRAHVLYTHYTSDTGGSYTGCTWGVCDYRGGMIYLLYVLLTEYDVMTSDIALGHSSKSNLPTDIQAGVMRLPRGR